MVDNSGAHGGTWALPHHLAAPPQTPTGDQPVDADEAEEFLRIFHGENPDAGSVERRVAWVRTEIQMTGSYQHTTAELSFGARVAWRNAARCIGRLYWRSLRVRDMRAVRGATEVAAQCVEHLRLAHNRGRLRPLITIFAPEVPGRPAPRIWNEQLIRYAGYRDGDGTVLGDPRYVDFTGTVTSMGWQPPAERGRFDVLPLVVETPEEGPRLFPLPRAAVDEVVLTHPDFPWFTEMGLRWHAVPAISNMRMVIGGVSYPAAPFNGWYMGTEIGARNLADADRYAVLPELAERMGLDTSSETTLWRDRALVELNRAVLHSYEKAGVTITDHHTESQHFLKHIAKEERAGRVCPADWSWIVPPVSGGLTPVFHRYYDTPHLKPEFVADDDAVERGLRGCPAHYADRPAEPVEDEFKPVMWAYLRGPKHAGVG
ncbi:nitric oxide synthase oxygenase [Allokutzneria oryzae]|uniref:Nitric oxide synthase oxygenase n=1 Tax=Allokutzneria oryzae TaxID=1378989 RepID=A0ABV5ZQD2_9PSEU